MAVIVRQNLFEPYGAAWGVTYPSLDSYITQGEGSSSEILLQWLPPLSSILHLYFSSSRIDFFYSLILFRLRI